MSAPTARRTQIRWTVWMRGFVVSVIAVAGLNRPATAVRSEQEAVDRVNDFETLLVMKPPPAARCLRVPARPG